MKFRPGSGAYHYAMAQGESARCIRKDATAVDRKKASLAKRLFYRHATKQLGDELSLQVAPSARRTTTIPRQS
jgi:hypothetical protein